MIALKLQGGLGNQFFQYALGRKLSILNGSELYLDRSNYKIFSTKRFMLLDKFNVLYKPLKKKNKNITLINEEKMEYDQDIFNLKENIILNGYWQSEKYFKDISEIIRGELSLKKPLPKKYLDLSARISSCNSIAIHFRRGDYVNNGYYYQCPPDYYYKAISIIKRTEKNPFFFIFSDDIEWCKKNVYLEDPHCFIQPTYNWNSYIDITLMSCCRHFIIANSSFSWWGAWLSKNPDKIIIAPEKWFCDENMITKDLIPSEWITI